VAFDDLILEGHEGRLQTTEQRLAELTTQVLPPLARLEEQFTGLKDDVGGLGSKLDSYIERLEKKIDGLGSRFDAIDKKVDALEGGSKRFKAFGKWIAGIFATIAAALLLRKL
jgi:ABC-type transporter Mla subunit MlaD